MEQSSHSNPVLAQYDIYRKKGLKSKKYIEKHKKDEEKLASKNPQDSESDEEISKPKKALHRQRAHINPMNDTPFPL